MLKIQIMKNNSIKQTGVVTKIVNMQPVTAPTLSEDAFYLMVLISQLKKLLGPASLQHFLATGESMVFTRQAS